MEFCMQGVDAAESGWNTVAINAAFHQPEPGTADRGSVSGGSGHSQLPNQRSYMTG